MLAKQMQEVQHTNVREHDSAVDEINQKYVVSITMLDSNDECGV